MSRYSGTEVCAFLVLLILGICILAGRDSTITTTFCGIAGVIVTRGLVKEEIMPRIVKKANGKTDSSSS